MNDRVKCFIANPWVEVACRWLLGITFIVASYPKMTEPAQFAKIIYGYQLVPEGMINLIAILLPYLEFYAGAALITGIFPRSAGVVISAMLLAFSVAITINLVRGHTFDCGCFAVGDTSHSAAAGGLLARDLVCCVIGAYIIWYKGPRKWIPWRSMAAG